MFRSWGELTSCASEVFDLFAEPLPAASGVNGAAPSQDVATTADVGLSRVGLECAFYVLFGRYPTPSLIADCFKTLSPSASPAHRASSAPPQQPARVNGFMTRSAYLRFVTLCAEEEGDGFVTEQPQGDAAASVTATASCVDGRKVAQLQWWRQFQSVAGPKGFIAADDLLGIHFQGPFADVQEVLAVHSPMCTSDFSTASPRNTPGSRQAPLVQHIFWILDRDHDGSVRFEDVQPYLQER
ncbi:hypothetical protein CGC21_7080 [Leishmania donovani]|uniref:EF-hand domain-containing protein n=1 Tax=Leishmania donovani TaxID=5661 RepID=A0A504X879_LEIDO|nr:hypothetical protein CGC21_7080 [Leishmania donovani]